TLDAYRRIVARQAEFAPHQPAVELRQDVFTRRDGTFGAKWLLGLEQILRPDGGATGVELEHANGFERRQSTRLPPPLYDRVHRVGLARRCEQRRDRQEEPD